MDFSSYEASGLNRPPPRSVNGRSSDEIVQSLAVPEDGQYNPCAEAYPNEFVPRGSLTRMRDWSESNIYPDTKRNISIYVSDGCASSGVEPAFAFFSDGDMAICGVKAPYAQPRYSTILSTAMNYRQSWPCL